MIALDVDLLRQALDNLDDNSCGDPECCGPQSFPSAEEIAAEYDRLSESAS